MPWRRSTAPPASARARSPSARSSSAGNDAVSRGNIPDQGKLSAYAELVRRWAPRLDLVSPADLPRLEDRHIADSLRLTPLLERVTGPCIDVGSGAGFPGVPLAIASGTVWRLLEPRVRRAAFLDEVVRELDLDCEVVRMTATDAARDPVFSRAHDLATARALAPAPAAFALLLPLVAAGGLAAVFHGPASELPEQAERWAPGVATMTAPATSLRKELED